jgi:hypothetical protein
MSSLVQEEREVPGVEGIEYLGERSGIPRLRIPNGDVLVEDRDGNLIPGAVNKTRREAVRRTVEANDHHAYELWDG